MPRLPDNSHKLLPNSSTKLEKNVARAMSFDTTLAPLPPLVRSAKLVDIPDSFIPWLIIEYGLAELGEFISDPRVLLAEGMAINRERGTPAAIKRALSWLGYDDITVWEEPYPDLHFAEYQIDLGKVPANMRDLCRIAKLVKSIQPVRARLRRVYHGYDVRHFYLDSSQWGDMLSHYSGERFDDKGFCSDTGLWASFANHHDLSINHDADMRAGLLYTRVNIYGLWVHPPLWPVLDVDYERGFYPSVGIVGLAMEREEGIGQTFYRPRWEALRYPSTRSVNEDKAIGMSYTRTEEE